jgi:MFS family permease
MPKKSSWTEYLRVLGRRDPRSFFAAGFISNFGSYLTTLAIPLAVYRMTGSVAALSSSWLVRIVVSIICLPLAGVLADRQNRRSILIFCNLGSVVADLLLLLGFHSSNLMIIFSGIALLQAADRFYGPSARAAFPGFFQREELPVANGLRQISSRVVDSLAPAIGGWLAELFGVGLLFILDAASLPV